MTVPARDSAQVLVASMNTDEQPWAPLGTGVLTSLDLITLASPLAQRCSEAEHSGTGCQGHGAQAGGVSVQPPPLSVRFQEA